MSVQVPSFISFEEHFSRAPARATLRLPQLILGLVEHHFDYRLHSDIVQVILNNNSVYFVKETHSC